MDVSTIQTVTSAAGAARTTLASNFDTFLKLLTAQLQNQDPLSPMDSNQFTQQLVQFSQVEQQITSNQNLEALIALTRGRNGMDAVSYLGKTITLNDGSAALADGEARWTYRLSGTSDASALVVTNASGKIVYANSGETAEGTHDFVWDGKDNAGNQLPPGAYTLSVTARTSEGTAVATSVASRGIIREIDLSGTEPLLWIGPMSVPFSKVSLVSETEL